MQLVLSQQIADDGDPRAARLRKLIGRKRTEKRRLEEDMQAIQVSIAELDALRRRRLLPLDDEIHDHFAFVLQSRKFSRDTRDAVSQLYAELMVTETISPRTPPQATGGVRAPFADADADADAEPDTSDPCPFCGVDHDAEAARNDPAEEAEAGRSTGDAGFGARQDHDHRHARGQPSAAPSGSSKSLRELYRDLAAKYHPDKARSETARVEHERLMREINDAYQSGDVDTLAALSRELGFEIAGSGVLEMLASQYEQIKAEVRALRHDVLGQLVVETRRSKKNGLQPPLVRMARDIEEHADHLDGLATVFRDFRSGVSSTDEFLLELLGEDDSEPMEDLLLTLVSLMEDRVGGPEPQPHRKPSKRRNGKQRSGRKKGTKRRKR